MKLPRTREEYTLFALKYSSEKQFSLAYKLENKSCTIRELNTQLTQWILATKELYPDLVRAVYYEEWNGAELYIAGVRIRSFNKHDEGWKEFIFRTIREWTNATA